ncbi:relaxase/mobilization nuclease domain-containing protein [Methylosinus sp. H3A]|uniref:relaxase/mobilization nuclease domain-containing protein n=1 Tax=Methylosinus sp. H3A TaxID=2785786 RepID=UPI0018C257E6|nr:relaxase/mobilization nuclease domain-containing protein [Methylosinus sp. H3A]MBG0812375.1 relaxase/mobilization nuclease domain-containing protein [Methylosinus sp. H3A]
MEQNLRVYLVEEMNRLASRARTATATAKDRDREILERSAPRRPARAPSRSRPIREHSRASPADPNPLPHATDRALRGTTITGREDEEKRRSLPNAPHGGAAKAPRSSGAASSGRTEAFLGRGASLQSRAGALAGGYRPAVVKVVSYAHGASRASATANYVDREDVHLESHDGLELKGREAINAEIAAWSKDFEQRAESQDVSSVRLGVIGLHDTAVDREALGKAMAAAFKGHSYAYRIEKLPGGAIEGRAVVAFAGTLGMRTETDWRDGVPFAKTIEERERFTVTTRSIGDPENAFAERVFAPKSEARMKARIEEATGIGQHRLSIEPARRAMVNRASFTASPSSSIAGPPLPGRARPSPTLPQFRRSRAHGARISAPSNPATRCISSFRRRPEPTSTPSRSVRGFLHEQFSDHKFIFGVHTDKEHAGHVHAHAIVAVRNAEGVKIHPGPQDFRAWREVFAEHAQTQGLKIVATSAAERASSQSYGPKDKAIVDAAERPRPGREARDRAYARDPANQTLIENARRRIDRAHTNPIRLPAGEPQRMAVNEARSAWFDVAKANPTNTTAVDLLRRVNMSAAAGDILAKIAIRVESYHSQEGPMAGATSEQLSSDLTTLNDIVDRASQALDPSTRETFLERSGRYLETLATRVDFTRLAEQGAQAVSAQTVQAVAGVRGQQLVDRAQELARTESQEAQAAGRVADVTAAAERRDEANAGLDATSAKDLLDERRAAAITERDAAREQREAIAAREAARQIEQNPAQVISQSLAQDDQLAALRREQERLAEEMKVEERPQRQTHGQKMS